MQDSWLTACRHGILTAHAKRTLTFVLLSIIICVGLFVRLEDLRDWQQQPEIAFFNGEPLLTTIDGYFYLRLARDLAEGNYHRTDTLRTWPEPPKRPFPPPLLSVITALLQKISTVSLNWIGVLLPTVFGIFVIAPVFAIGRYYGGTTMGLTASLITVLSFGYLTRSSLGWFDTDCLNVFFTMAAIYYSIRFSEIQTYKRYIYFILFLINYAFFLWWWHTTPQAVTVITLLPMLVSLFFFYRPTTRREGLIFLGTLSLLLSFLLYWLGIDLPMRIINNLSQTFHYISKETNQFFPNVSELVLEQHKASWHEFVATTIHSKTAFIAALAGTAGLILKKHKKFLFLLAPALLTCMTLLFSQRFIIFAVPVISLGFGYCISSIWQLRKRFPRTVFLAPLFVVYVAAINLHTDMSKNFWQFNVGNVVAGMNFVRENTPDNSILFARWDVGYPCQYWARRTTVADGGFHGGERSVYNSIPLAAESDRMAANFINFLVTRGMQGFATVYKAVDGDRDRGLRLIKKILKAGPIDGYNILLNEQLASNTGGYRPEEWLQFFFPKNDRPIYLFLDYEATQAAYWWFWLGTWNVEAKNGTHPRFRSFLEVLTNGHKLSNGGDLYGSLDDGTMTTPVRTTRVRSAQLIQSKNWKWIIYYPITQDNKENFFSLYIPGKFAALEGTAIHHSLFSQLFVQHQISPYFEPIKRQTPAFHIYKVIPDLYRLKDQ